MKLNGLSSTVMPPTAVTLTFDLLIPKANQHVCELEYICDQNWVKFPSSVWETRCSQSFRDALTHLRTYRSKYRMPPEPFLNGDGGIKKEIG